MSWAALSPTDCRNRGDVSERHQGDSPIETTSDLILPEATLARGIPTTRARPRRCCDHSIRDGVADRPADDVRGARKHYAQSVKSLEPNRLAGAGGRREARGVLTGAEAECYRRAATRPRAEVKTATPDDDRRCTIYFLLWIQKQPNAHGFSRADRDATLAQLGAQQRSGPRRLQPRVGRR
jgi:hypothetical protein